ncbi:hypothetical protein Tco_0550814 [Tanacetum coccineum]
MAIYLPFEMTQPFKIVDDGKMSFFLGLPRFLKIPEASLSTSKFVRKSEKGLVLTTMPPLTLSMAKRPLDEDKGGKLIDLYTISCLLVVIKEAEKYASLLTEVNTSPIRMLCSNPLDRFSTARLEPYRESALLRKTLLHCLELKPMSPRSEATPG